jgi:transposase
MKNHITFVGLDVHKEKTQVAMIKPFEQQMIEWSQKSNASRLIRRLRKEAGEKIVCCYEAGPCGYALQRELKKAKIRCMVVAPSLIPRKPGERIKTDRRDAKKLARLLRSGDLTEVHPPSVEQEATRDVCRAREDAKEDLLRSRHRLQKFLLRRGIAYGAGKKSWTQAHRAWLRRLRFDEEAEERVFNDYLRMVELLEERVKDWVETFEELARREPYATPVGYLRCFRGIDTVTALSLVAELHGFMRFQSARALMAYLGMVPSEDSSGDKRRQGSISKTGNSHARRVLIEAAWHYRHAPRAGKTLQSRRKGQPAWVVAVADKAQHRLHRRYWRLVNRGKPHNKAVVAVARELLGFVWAVLYREGIEALSDTLAA